jgi:thioredoxin reductase (NADPH)
MFPSLNDAQFARLAPLGKPRHISAGEILYDLGEVRQNFYVVISGALEVESQSRRGETVLRKVGPREFTGELALLTGRRTLVRVRATAESELLELDLAGFRHIVDTDAELSEIFLRAFLLRRAYLIAHTPGDAVIIGSSYSADTLRLDNFLTRNGQPHTYLDVDRDPAVQDLLDQFQIRPDEIPVMICRGKTALRNPSNAEAAACLGFNPAMEEGHVFDLVVVGAGPAGLAAAVYAASEGLDVMVLEGNAPGGQAGSSSRIENYLGFPTGVSGQDLAGRAFVQAEKFGANVAIGRTAARLHCERLPFRIELTGAGSVLANAVIVACGAEYRKLPLPNLSQFEGSGIYYGATHVEARLCGGDEVVIVGGGNSAGQAAVFLAQRAGHVHLLIRGEGLAATMSRYLIRRIEENPGITLRTRTEIEKLEGNGRLERVTWRDGRTGATETRTIHHIFSMTGACPNTRWLQGCLSLDEKEFVKTGADLHPEDLTQWTLRRQPYLFETSIPRVFAVGDVRSGSVKRVAAGVGEGSIAVQLIHKVLAE